MRRLCTRTFDLWNGKYLHTKNTAFFSTSQFRDSIAEAADVVVEHGKVEGQGRRKVTDDDALSVVFAPARDVGARVVVRGNDDVVEVRRFGCFKFEVPRVAGLNLAD